MTDDRKCDSPKRGVKGIREVSQLTERCDGYEGGVMVMGRSKRTWGGASLDRKCDSHQGGVKGIKNECQLMERCDGHGVGVRGWKGVRRCDGCQEV